MSGRPADDLAIERVVGTLLRWGVLLAAGVTALGGLLLLLQDGTSRPALGVFSGGPASHTALGPILRGALAGDGAAIVQLGVVLLIATPIARVGFTLVAFLRQRDRFYAAVTATVLAILLFSLLFGGIR